MCLETSLEVCLDLTFLSHPHDLTPPNLEWEVWMEFFEVCLECDLTSHPHDLTLLEFLELDLLVVPAENENPLTFPNLEWEVWMEFFDVCLEWDPYLTFLSQSLTSLDFLECLDLTFLSQSNDLTPIECEVCLEISLDVCLECLDLTSHPHDFTDLEFDLLVVLIEKENPLTFLPKMEWEVCLEMSLDVCLECLDLTSLDLFECLDLTSHSHDLTSLEWIDFTSLE